MLQKTKKILGHFLKILLKNVKMKIIIAIIFAILAYIGVLYYNIQQDIKRKEDLESKKLLLQFLQEYKDQKSKKPTPSPTLTKDQELQEYYDTYKNPFVIHIRKALNGYLNGTYEGIDSSKLVLMEGKLDENTKTGLDSFSSDYYKSKFIILTYNKFLLGGVVADILFQDKPDKVFSVWIYKLSNDNYVMRGFWENNKFTPELINKYNKNYEVFLNDKEHSL